MGETDRCEQAVRQCLARAAAAQQAGDAAEARRLYRIAGDVTRAFAGRAAGERRARLLLRAEKLDRLADGGRTIADALGEPPDAGKAIDRDAAPPEPLEALQRELNAFIGLAPVKAQVDGMIRFLRVADMRKARGLPTENVMLHMVFSGNPGTGKTTVARLLGKMYRSLGLLRTGQLIETQARDLIAGYVGQTALKTGDVIQRALGGVLFIDEAYALSGSAFGREAVDTLMKAMEDHRRDFLVIAAGYRAEMEAFVRSNPGLHSRFKHVLDFPDYTEEEWTRIFLQKCAQGGYRAADQTEEAIREAFALFSARQPFGNGRDARNLYERAIVAQASRLTRAETPPTRQALMILTAEDIRAAIPPKALDQCGEWRIESGAE